MIVVNSDHTLVTAVTPDYVDRLYWSLPSWTVKPQFRDRPVIVYHAGFTDDIKRLDFVKACYPQARFIEWTMPKYDGQRELMLSSFILGAARDVETPHFIKLDADCYCRNAEDVFKPEDFAVDLCAHAWGYTKPGWWADKMNAWVEGRPWDGPKDSGKRGFKRIISFCCLHKTSFVQAAAKLAGERLPIPSHDSFIWHLAAKCADVKWSAINAKARGVDHCHNARGIREAVCAGDGAWNPVHNSDLLSHVQLEVTSKCNLRCPNCDRACGLAPTDECMSMEEIVRFFAESEAAGWPWKRVDIIGGEPTLWPHLDAFLDRAAKVSKKLKWRLTTNGTNTVNVPEWVEVRNSAEEKKHPVFETYNVAPVDKGVKAPVKCSIPWRCGLGLSSRGYFPCGAGAAVARVFGLDIGIKTLAELTPERLRAQMDKLCLLCGHSRACVEVTDKQETSRTWAQAVLDWEARWK